MPPPHLPARLSLKKKRGNTAVIIHHQKRGGEEERRGAKTGKGVINQKNTNKQKEQGNHPARKHRSLHYAKG